MRKHSKMHYDSVKSNMFICINMVTLHQGNKLNYLFLIFGEADFLYSVFKPVPVLKPSTPHTTWTGMTKRGVTGHTWARRILGIMLWLGMDARCIVYFIVWIIFTDKLLISEGKQYKGLIWRACHWQYWLGQCLVYLKARVVMFLPWVVITGDFTRFLPACKNTFGHGKNGKNTRTLKIRSKKMNISMLWTVHFLNVGRE